MLQYKPFENKNRPPFRHLRIDLDLPSWEGCPGEGPAQEILCPSEGAKKEL